MRILGIDPGEFCGFAVVEGESNVSKLRVQRTPVTWMGATIEDARAYLQTHGQPDAVVIEDQYLGKAGNSVLTVSQRAGYIIGALGLDPEIVYFVKPNPWYKAIGMPARCTKQVCMYRIQKSLSLTESAIFELVCEHHPKNRLDVAAAIGLAWSWEKLPASAKKRKLLVFAKPRPKKKARRKPRRA